MKIYLDDERKPPDDSWTLVKLPSEAIRLLEKFVVKCISLDHDLGKISSTSNKYPVTGYDVLLWMEEEVNTAFFKPPAILIHTSNPSARKKMESARMSIMKMWTELNRERGPMLYSIVLVEYGNMYEGPYESWYFTRLDKAQNFVADMLELSTGLWKKTPERQNQNQWENGTDYFLFEERRLTL